MPDRQSFNSAKWYWVVAGSVTQVYSTASADYVPVNDATYVAWLAAGFSPTASASEDELGEVLAQWELRPTPAGMLDEYRKHTALKLPAVIFKVLHNHENRVRALEGQSSVTAAQFRNALKQLF